MRKFLCMDRPFDREHGTKEEQGFNHYGFCERPATHRIGEDRSAFLLCDFHAKAHIDGNYWGTPVPLGDWINEVVAEDMERGLKKLAEKR